jgi:hypothetical protein
MAGFPTALYSLGGRISNTQLPPNYIIKKPGKHDVLVSVVIVTMLSSTLLLNICIVKIAQPPSLFLVPLF